MLFMANVSIVEWLLNHLQPPFAQWGYLIVFAFAFLERSFMVGLVVPGNAVVLLGGVYAGQGDLNIAVVILLAFIGSLAGDNLGYLLGLKVGLPLIHRHGKFLRLGERVSLAEKYYERHGPVTVLTGRFVTFLGTLTCPVAGLSRMNYRKFLKYDIVGAVIWSLGFGLLGYFLGRNYELIVKIFNYIGNALLAVILAAILVAYIVYRVKEHRELESELDETADE